MGLIEFFTNWKYVGKTPNKKKLSIPPDIIKILKKKIDKNISYQTKKWLKQNKGHAPFGRTIRGVKNLPSFTGVGYAKGKTFLYKGKEIHYYIDNHGHGGAISHGMKIWKKLRADRR